MIVKLLAASILLGAATLAAQVSETIDVRVVNVDVTVTSKSGPVRGLTRDDFEIFEDGRRQTITNFYASDETRAVAAKTDVVTAPAVEQPDTRFRRKVLVLVDNNHTTKHSRQTALSELEEMINDRFHGDYEWSIGVIGRGVTLVLPLSSDKKAIHEALEIIRRAGTRREDAMSFAGASDREASMLQRTETTTTPWASFDSDYATRLAQADIHDDSERVIAAKFTVPAILDAARGFASSSGRKIVLLLTGDPGLNDIEIVQPAGDGFSVRAVGRGATKVWQDQASIEELRKRIVREANASGVSFYIWNVEGLIPEETNTSAVFWLAKQTGGRLVTGNDPGRAIREFDTASSTFYSLGYSPTHQDDGKYHSITVRLKQKADYSLEYRSGYAASPSSVQLARAMTSPTAAAMQANALPVTMALGTSQDVRDGVSVPIEIKVPFRSLQFLPGKTGVAANLVVYISVFNEMGKNLVASSFPLTPGFKSGSPDLNGTLVYRNAISMRKGERHRVVVAVRDVTTDSVGMATQVVRF
ncbi:MAG: hypothetical protein QOK37_747 [Thermoanaerobaculia bacterium]|jgi:VWFA-related protein|nr:hypothetical protein [Thermoanaerobaculia bacterium]